ncbi:MAG: hypothetical protein ABSA90_04270 [Xanthobacteraceae bacterium]|jgi:hypothetical protein
MSAFSVYDGQRWLGSIYERSDGSYTAKDSDGRKLGTFHTIEKAAAAITDLDEVLNACRKDAGGVAQ